MSLEVAFWIVTGAINGVIAFRAGNPINALLAGGCLIFAGYLIGKREVK